MGEKQPASFDKYYKNGVTDFAEDLAVLDDNAPALIDRNLVLYEVGVETDIYHDHVVHA